MSTKTERNENVAIKVDHVSKSFKLPHEKNSTIKSAVVNFYRRKRSYEEQRALENVTFDVRAGEFYGIVGRNGSGKSTMLKMLAGIYQPTKGHITVNGKLTPFIELGVGFNPELTGRENVFLNGALLGFSRKEMLAMYDDIVAFAELERFMDQKLKNYSSGMHVRLAFSIAIRANSDVLLIDEVLAVGDAVFQKKCYDYFKELKKNKKTVIFVSHDTGALLEYCDRGVLINDGNVVTEGEISKVVHTYVDLLNKAEQRNEPDKETLHKDKRWGTGDMEVGNVSVSRPNGGKGRVFDDTDKTIEIEVTFIAKKPLERPVYGITITDPTGQIIFQSNTLWCNQKTVDVEPGQRVVVNWSIPNAFTTGTFQLSPAVSDAIGSAVYDWLEDAVSFKVRKEQKSHGVINVEHDLQVRYE